MSSLVLWVFAIIGGLTAVVGIGWVFHRVCTRLEERGYLHYRKSSGGSGGVLYELDKITRPSIQHVIEVQDTILEEQENDGH